jgi:hypothetical protein
MDAVLRICQLSVGTLIVLGVSYDVFQSVLVPRRSGRRFRLAPLFVMFLWRAWRWQALRIRSSRLREDFLGMFAPFALVALLLCWVLSLLFGYGLLLSALGEQVKPPIDDFGTALYLAGTSLFTIGFGDLVRTGGGARCLLLAAAMSGLAVLALVVSLIFSLHGAFGRREMYVLTLAARAGAPPTGVGLLETFAQFNMAKALPEMFSAWELWCADMLQSHLAFPLLPYFRSIRENQSWISAMGAVLDAATLLLTTVDLEDAVRDGSCQHAGLRGSANMTYSLGAQTVSDLADLFQGELGDFSRGGAAASIHDVLVDRSEFDAAVRRLRKAGYRLLDLDLAWKEFVTHRSTYAARLNALAKHFAAPPAQWIGDRSAIPQRSPLASQSRIASDLAQPA